ncbi:MULTISPECIES: LD-carboxypeptidase [Bacillus]|uniref:S66 peptidase family protein n=1 Tax=Bacillus TaxID=1386 RepID=UPI0028825A19|nr:LD-carboxypeptidase [Bacillus sp. AG4(2022)]MDT0159716.1 LD-carboxypeptidase [Bacillus sp. AG4(2022)]
MKIKPGLLKKGDAVGVVSPASPPDVQSLDRGIDFLKELGLEVREGKSVRKINGYLAGSDKERLEDLHDMFEDKEIKAVICAGGGYGTARIAADLDYGLIKANPKIFWGYSDITFLHTSIRQKTGLITFHGPMLASDIGKADAHPLSKQYFSQLFQPADSLYTEELSPLSAVVEGRAEGPLTGGNLCLIASTLGTSYEIDVKGKLLLIEDINEEPRSVDRMLNQLLMAGKLSEAAGVVVGDFNKCEPQRDLSLSLDEVLDHYLIKAGRPAMKGFKIGHCSPHFSVPLGADAVLDTTEKQLYVESGVR